MKADELKEKISNLTIWKNNGKRAPHKPLLILYALGRFQNEDRTSLTYEETRGKLKSLLMEFGPASQLYHPEYPFVHLVSDEIWVLNKLVDKLHFSDKQLLTDGVRGGFNDEVILLLESDKYLVQELAHQILEQHFPDTMHEDILEEVDLNYRFYKKRSRDPLFRDQILRAYEHSCAVCGFNVRLDRNLVGIEAAHIQWHQAGGPDREENGIALCSLHHKLFDRGVFTISTNKEMLVSEAAYGTQGFDDWLMRYHGKKIRSPINQTYQPKESYIHWHFREVFKRPSRYVV